MTPRGIVLRRLGPDDLALALRLREDFRPGLATEAGLAAFLADGRCWLFAAVAENRVAGFACGWECPRMDGKRMLYIHELAVAEDRRRRGVGARLLAALLARCGREGVEKAFLFTQRGNRAANALYRKLGGDVSPDSRGNDVVYWFRADATARGKTGSRPMASIAPQGARTTGTSTTDYEEENKS